MERGVILLVLYNEDVDDFFLNLFCRLVEYEGEEQDDEPDHPYEEEENNGGQMVGQGVQEVDDDQNDYEESADSAPEVAQGMGDFASDTLEPHMGGHYQMPGQTQSQQAYEAPPQAHQQFEEPEVKQDYEEPVEEPAKKQAYEASEVQESYEQPRMQQDFQEADVPEPIAQKSEPQEIELEPQEQGEAAPGKFSWGVSVCQVFHL